uniref:Uncharacterized protein n=1 Tax=Oryza glumipatula TaxID=40148 RepID=A0A0D9ZKK0_9ORYZ
MNESSLEKQVLTFNTAARVEGSASCSRTACGCGPTSPSPHARRASICRVPFDLADFRNRSSSPARTRRRDRILRLRARLLALPGHPLPLRRTGHGGRRDLARAAAEVTNRARSNDTGRTSSLRVDTEDAGFSSIFSDGWISGSQH